MAFYANTKSRSFVQSYATVSPFASPVHSREEKRSIFFNENFVKTITNIIINSLNETLFMSKNKTMVFV